MVTFWKRFAQSLHHAFHFHYGMHLQVTTQNEHIKTLCQLHFCGCGHCGNGIHTNIFTCGWLHHTKSIKNQSTTRLYFRLEFINRGLIEENSCVVVGKNRRRNFLITDNYSNISCSSTLFWTIGWHPTHFFAFHQSGISQDFSHRENALSAESCNNYLLCHKLSD